MSMPSPIAKVQTSGTLPPTNGAQTSPAIRTEFRGDAQSSIIGDDLTITGQSITIRSDKSVRIDGSIDGDIEAKEVVIGPRARVQGTITAERVDIEGHVAGTIRAHNVNMQSTASIEGDIYHQSMSVQAGATFNGRSKKLEDVATTKSDASQPAHQVEAET